LLFFFLKAVCVLLKLHLLICAHAESQDRSSVACARAVKRAGEDQKKKNLWSRPLLKAPRPATRINELWRPRGMNSTTTTTRRLFICRHRIMEPCVSSVHSVVRVVLSFSLLRSPFFRCMRPSEDI